jgi:hypothetical protein
VERKAKEPKPPKEPKPKREKQPKRERGENGVNKSGMTYAERYVCSLEAVIAWIRFFLLSIMLSRSYFRTAGQHWKLSICGRMFERRCISVFDLDATMSLLTEELVVRSYTTSAHC